MDNNTTEKLIIQLGEDVDKCHKNLLDVFDEGPDDEEEFHARQLIRSIFAFIEALTFSVKVHAAYYGLSNEVDISFAERYFAADVDHLISNRGEVIERAAHIRLSDNVRFAFMLQEKALGIDEAFDASVDWWSCLQSSIKVRDRLTHPKLPGDIDITGEEVLTALQAFNGFKDQIMMYANERIE